MKAIVSATVEVMPQFYDLDPMNVVWHGHYPRFLELARVAVLERIDYGYAQMIASGYSWPVIDMQLRYIRPLRLGQAVLITGSIVEWENRLRMNYELRDARTGQRTTRGYTIQVAVDRRTEEMLWETPTILRDRLAPFLA